MAGFMIFLVAIVCIMFGANQQRLGCLSGSKISLDDFKTIDER